ncbi:MAG: hypothetical protein KIPDCIKN_00397 [Haliscomenobacter sp.]|nr:hypothetical protein [Haliscomenobacter sp.]
MNQRIYAVVADYQVKRTGRTGGFHYKFSRIARTQLRCGCSEGDAGSGYASHRQAIQYRSGIVRDVKTFGIQVINSSCIGVNVCNKRCRCILILYNNAVVGKAVALIYDGSTYLNQRTKSIGKGGSFIQDSRGIRIVDYNMCGRAVIENPCGIVDNPTAKDRPFSANMDQAAVVEQFGAVNPRFPNPGVSGHPDFPKVVGISRVVDAIFADIICVNFTLAAIAEVFAVVDTMIPQGIHFDNPFVDQRIRIDNGAIASIPIDITYFK